MCVHTLDYRRWDALLGNGSLQVVPLSDVV